MSDFAPGDRFRDSSSVGASPPLQYPADQQHLGLVVSDQYTVEDRMSPFGAYRFMNGDNVQNIIESQKRPECDELFSPTKFG